MASSTDAESFAALTAAGREESSASESQPEESRDRRESATQQQCNETKQSLKGVISQSIVENSPADEVLEARHAESCSSQSAEWDECQKSAVVNETR